MTKRNAEALVKFLEEALEELKKRKLEDLKITLTHALGSAKNLRTHFEGQE